MMITRNIQLDVAMPGSQLALYARKGDTRVYALNVSLCEKSVPVAVPEAWTAALRAKKPDGTVLFGAAAADGGRIRAYLGTQALTAAGLVQCQVDVYGPFGEALFSPRFDICVEEPVFGDEGIESADEFSALTTALAKVAEAVDGANRGAEAANEAADSLCNMTVGAHKLPPGSAPTADISNISGYKHIDFGLVTGEPGRGLVIKAHYPSLQDLMNAHPEGEAGDAYAVGDPEAASVLLYLWDTERGKWVSAGTWAGDARPINGIYPDGDGYRLAAEDIPTDDGRHVQAVLDEHGETLKTHTGAIIAETDAHGIRYRNERLQIFIGGGWVSLVTNLVGRRWQYLDGLDREWQQWDAINHTWAEFENMMETEVS